MKRRSSRAAALYQLPHHSSVGCDRSDGRGDGLGRPTRPERGALRRDRLADERGELRELAGRCVTRVDVLVESRVVAERLQVVPVLRGVDADQHREERLQPLLALDPPDLLADLPRRGVRHVVVAVGDDEDDPVRQEIVLHQLPAVLHRRADGVESGVVEGRQPLRDELLVVGGLDLAERLEAVQLVHAPDVRRERDDPHQQVVRSRRLLAGLDRGEQHLVQLVGEPRSRTRDVDRDGDEGVLRGTKRTDSCGREGEVRTTHLVVLHFTVVFRCQSRHDDPFSKGAVFQATPCGCGSGQELERGGQDHALAHHLLEPGVRHGREVRTVRHRRDRRGRVGQEVELADQLLVDLVDHLLHRLHHAVREGLTGEGDDIRLLQHFQQPGVETGAGVVGHGHLGFEGAVVLRPGVGALRHVVNRGEVLRRPAFERRLEIGLHGVAVATNQAVNRPHHEQVTPLRFQRRGVPDHVLLDGLPAEVRRLGIGVPRRPDAGLDVVRGDGRERGRRRLAVGSHPHGGVTDVDQLVAVERHVNAAQLVTDAVDHRGQPHHVLVGTRHRQSRVGVVHEVVLRVDHHELHVARHDGYSLFDSFGC